MSNHAAKAVNGAGAIALALVCTFAAPALAQWGHLKGRFVYDGAAPTPAVLVAGALPVPVFDETLVVGKDGGVKNVVVFVRDKDLAVHPDLENALPDSVEFEVKDQRIEPHVGTMTLSQRLIVENRDNGASSIFISSGGASQYSSLLRVGSSFEYEFDRVPPTPATPIYCQIKPFLKAYVVVQKHPYAAVSAADGSFEIRNLPAGELEFQAWHEKEGYVRTAAWKKGRFKVNIPNGQTHDLGVIRHNF